MNLENVLLHFLQMIESVKIFRYKLNLFMEYK